MRKIAIVIAFCMLVSHALDAAIYNIPKLGMGGTPSGSVTLKSLKEETRIVGNGFQVVIPKGWSLNPVGESNQQFISFNANPTEDQEKDPVYFGIHRTKKELDLKKIKETQKEKKRFTKEVSEKLFSAIQSEYLDKKSNAKEEQIFVWYVKAKTGYFIVLAGAPKEDQKNIRSLRSILASIKFD